MKKINLKFLVAVAIVIFNNNLFSQTLNENQIDDINLPILNGHQFITNSFIPNPFIKSKINSGLGFATSIETEIPLNRFGDSAKFKVNADITYANGFFKFDYAVNDWAMIWLNFSGVARVGTNTPSILLSGVTANTVIETGMLFKIKEFKKSLLSTSFKLKNSGSTDLNIYEFLKNIRDTNDLFRNSIVNNYNPLQGFLDLRFAYAPSPKWNILSYIAGGYGEVINEDSIENKFSYQFGASVNYNLAITTDFPFGIGGAFKINSNSPTEQYYANTTQLYMFQIIYTGSKDFLIGLESNYVRIPTKYDDITISLTSFNIVWTYFFK